MDRRPLSDKTSLLRDVDGLYIVVEQDVSQVLDTNKAFYNEKQSLAGTQRHRVKVAEIPDALYFKLRQEFGPPKHNQEAWRRWLNDPDNRLFRTWHGTV